MVTITNLNRERRHRRQAAGQCPQCGTADTDGKLCDRCYTAKQVSKQKPRLACLEAYGARCVCCGETELAFLQIAHINNDGAKERKQAKEQGLAANIYSRLRKQGYPAGFQVLCANCNMARAFYGYCPHRPNLKVNIRRKPKVSGN